MSIDIREVDALELLEGLDDNSAHLLLTDIPYDVVTRSSGGLRSLDKGKADTLTFDVEEFCRQAYRVTSNNGVIFCSSEQFSEVRGYFSTRGVTTRVIVWEKTNPSPMNGQYLFLSGVELAVYFRKPKATFNGHCQNTVFRYPNGKSTRHPTEKNLKLFLRLVTLLSDPGHVVLDPCVGSGTTAVAAVMTGCCFIGGDIDPASVELTKSRVRGYSG